MLKEMRNNPLLKKAFALGEEQVGKIASQLLSNERFVKGIQATVSTALSAKGSLDKSLRRVLSAMNLPSRDDVDSLAQKLADLEATLDAISEKVGQLAEKVERGEKRAKNGDEARQ
jgi:hypothetical protein